MEVITILHQYIRSLIHYIDRINNRGYQLSVPLLELDGDIYHARIIIRPAVYLDLLIKYDKKGYEETLKNLFLQVSNDIANARLYIKVLPNEIEINLYFLIRETRLLDLPSEVLAAYVLPLPYNDIKNLCASNTEIERTICDVDVFWKQKLTMETGANLPIINGQMEKVYLNYGTLWGFGSSNKGQLGVIGSRLPPMQIQTNKKVKCVSCGMGYTMYVTYDGELWSIGRNAGRFGSHGRADDKIIPEKITAFYENKQDFSDEIRQLPFIVDVKCNVRDCLVLDDAGYIWNLFLGGFIKVNLPLPIKCFSLGEYHFMGIDVNNDLWGWGYDVRQPSPMGGPIYSTPTNLNFKAKFISCGVDFTLVIDLDDEIWASGSNEGGQLGLGHNNDVTTWTKLHRKAKFISCGFDHTMMIDFNDDVWACGGNAAGQLGLGNFENSNVFKHVGMKAKFLMCGPVATLIIDLDNMLLACGNNDSGKLGIPVIPYESGIPPIGDERNYYNSPTKIDFPYKVKNVSCGYNHSALTVLY